MSVYFHDPGGGKLSPTNPFGSLGNLVTGAAGEIKSAAKTGVTAVKDAAPIVAKVASAPATRVVPVKAHTRTIQVKTPPPTPAVVLPPINTQSVRPAPAQVSTVQRFAPHYPGEPAAGYAGSHLVTRPGGGSYRAARPYYTDAYTASHRHGPAGQESTQWNAAQVAAAHRIQVANYGTPGYVLRSLLPGGLDEGGVQGPGKALSRGIAVASMLPGGGVGEAAGILGFGLKGLRVVRTAKDVAEVAPKAAEEAPKAAHVAEEAAAVRGAGPAPGFVRLYRGEGKTASVTQEAKDFYGKGHDVGGWFTDTRAVAEEYARRNKGQVHYVDIPADTARPWARARESDQGQKWTEYRFPDDSAAGRFARENKQPVTELGTPRAAHVTEEAAVVRGAMPGAKILRGKQEAGYSVERSKRVAAARVHLENPDLTPAERVGKAKGELVGELPKIDFQGFKELNAQSLQALQTHILEHPRLSFFQKINASDALAGALAGRVPTRSEILLLEHVFGKDTAAGLGSVARSPFRDRLLSALNVPRSLMASFDLSAPFRQGLMVSTRHPQIFARNFGSMIKAFGSESVYHGMLDEIRARPTYPMMLEAKLPITELGRDVGSREERFASDYAEKLTGGKYGPVRASGRAYTGFLDKTRADVFDHLIKSAQSQGVNVQDPEFLQSLGKYIGSATGRGDLGHFQEAGKVLNAVLFSPRLLASRLNFLNPYYYAKLDPFARKEALRSALQLAGTASTLVALASQIPGVKVETDPRNPDWGKIRIGNTRLDIGGGFQQPLRLLAQFGTGVAISSTTGKSLSLTSGGFGKPTRLDIVQRFFEGKASPIASLALDWMRGSTQIGQKFSWKSEAAQRMTPLLGQDALDLYKERHGGMNGLMAALAGYGVGSVGIGLQTYGPAKPKTRTPAPANYFGGSGSGGGSPYFSSPSQSGGGGYFGK